MRLLPKKQLAAAVKNWWVHLIIGTIFIVFGCETLRTPEASFFSLYQLFSIIVVLAGAAQLFYSISNRKHLGDWGWHLSAGAFDLTVGLILISRTIISAELLPYFIGLWLAFRGINGVSFAINLKEHGVKTWWVTLSIFIATGILGVLVIIEPTVGFANITKLTAYAFIALGLVVIGSGLHVRQLHKLPQKMLQKLPKRSTATYHLQNRS